MKGFRTFLLRGNVVDLAVGIVIGAAFTGIVTKFVAAFLTPIVGVITHHSGDFNGATFKIGTTVFPYGDFISAVISFVIVAAVIYFCVVLPVNRLSARFATKADVTAPKKDCPECLSSIPAAATRCAFCTAQVHFATVPRQ
jgi:large conductance mechanosensitive channel